MAQPEVPVPTAGKWEVSQLRVTTFLAPDATELTVVAPGPWWAQIVGTDPDEEISRPKLGELRQVGTYEGKRLTLSVQPGRVDWLMEPVLPAPDAYDDQLLTAGPFDEVREAFVRPIRRWLSSAPLLKRIAFGAVLQQSAADRKAGYQQLQVYLRRSLVIDPDGSSDLLYQINRPRISSVVAGLVVNRLSRWTAGVTGLLSVRLPLTGKGRPALVARPGNHVCNLNLDINTAAEFVGTLEAGRLADLLDELVGMGKQITVEGDVP